MLIQNKQTMKKMGKNLLSFPKKNFIGMIAVEIVAIILLAILIFRDFRGISIVAACCVLSVFLITRDGFNQKNYGLYENGMIVPNFVIFYEDIITFPVDQLPLEEQEHYAKNTLILVTQKGKCEVVFEAEELCQTVKDKLKELGIRK